MPVLLEDLAQEVRLLRQGAAAGYTDEQVRDVIGTALVAGSNITITVDDDAETITVEGSAGGSGLTRATVTKTTASLANNARESGTVTMGKSWMLTKVVADRACRVRLYETTTLRDADASRGAFAKPSGNAGCVFDLVLSASVLTWYCVPNVSGSDDDGTVVANVPVTIDNLSGAASTVAVTFTYFVLEA